MTTDLVICGHCASGFESVREAFRQNFRDGLEVGAATAAVVEGETVVDLWAGHTDADRTRPWNRGTIVQVMSTTKGITALVAHRLVERGLLDLEAPVAKYWPEFAAADKEGLPVRYLLTHQAGLPALDEWQPPGTLQSWEAVTTLLARQKPLWEPGSNFGYHALTFGFLVGEVVRRVSGKTVGQLIRDEIARPLAVDFELGFAQAVNREVADLLDTLPVSDGKLDLVNIIKANPLSVLSRAFVLAIPSEETGFNSPAARAAEVPSANGHSNARSLARIYGALSQGGQIDGIHLLSQERITAATEKQVGGTECVSLADMHFGLGFALRRPADTLIGPRAFGHAGFGGSEAFADPDRKLGFSYVMNQLGRSSPEQFGKSTLPDAASSDPRATNILRALYDVL